MQIARSSGKVTHSAICVSIVLVLTFTSGCNTLRTGGAPKPITSFKADYQAIERSLQASASIDNYFKTETPTQAERDKFISARLTLINLRYIEFLRASTSERQAIDAAHDMLVMGLGVAGAAFTPAGTKTVLAAASAGVTGTKSTLEKNYFQEKTMPALISEMNARRSEALAPILTGMKQPVSEYGIGQAVADLQIYYEAGTYLGAVQSIQYRASVRDAVAQDELKKIRALPAATAAQAALKKTVNPIVANMVQTDEAAWRAVYQEFFKLTPPATFDELKDAMWKAFRDLKPEQMTSFSDLLSEKKLIK